MKPLTSFVSFKLNPAGNAYIGRALEHASYPPRGLFSNPESIYAQESK